MIGSYYVHRTHDKKNLLSILDKKMIKRKANKSHIK